MTLICSEGHSEHDELSCVSTFFRGKHPAPKAPERSEGTYRYLQFDRLPERDALATDRSVKVPRMSKQRRLEWSFFLDHRNRISYNLLCRGCIHGCKQSFRAIVVLCPHYWSKRWKPPD